MSPRTIFEEELTNLKDDIKEIGREVEKSYDHLFEAIGLKDVKTIKNIMRNDSNVNKMQREIETRCLFLIGKQQPVAKDLRMISAALKVVTDIERVGDHVVDIAELVLRLNFVDFNYYSKYMSLMIEETKKIIHDALDAFINGDEEAARGFAKRDDIIDDLFNQVKSDIVQCLKDEKQNVDECVDILMIAKYLEKIGDHAVNISEWEVFKATGSIQDFRLF